MTAIKPIANRRVVAVAAETYPINAVCAHPECSEPAVDPHHSFPRSAIGGDSFFVSITFDTYEDAVEVLGKNPPVNELSYASTGQPSVWISAPIPHAIGLCRAHHDHVEQRVAKISLEDGTYLYWEGNDGRDGNRGSGAAMVLVGELNPQPGATKPKRKKSRFQGDQRRKRKVISIRVPDDTENGGEVWDTTLDLVKAKLVGAGLYSETDDIPIYEAVVAGLTDWLNTTG